MITQALISFVLGGALFLINLLPVADSGVISNITSFASGFKTTLVNANFIFPIDTLLVFIGIVFTCESVVFGFKIARWVATLISGGLIKAH